LSPGARGPLPALRRLLLSAAVAGTVLVAGLVIEQASRFGGGDGAPWQIEADLSLTAFVMERVGTDGVEVRLKADRAQVLETNRRLVAQGIDVAFFDGGRGGPQTGRTTRLSAERGEVELDAGTVHVSGEKAPARLALADGTVFTAPALSWDPASGTVRTEGGAAMAGAGFTAEGGDAVANIAKQYVRLIGGVRVEWAP
jgi:LPS export ABC transporter protein LptC